MLLRTIEISLGKAYDFNKPYSQYLELRHEIRENNGDTKSTKKNRRDRKINRKIPKKHLAHSTIDD
jgi:hypothetical protein